MATQAASVVAGAAELRTPEKKLLAANAREILQRGLCDTMNAAKRVKNVLSSDKMDTLNQSIRSLLDSDNDEGGGPGRDCTPAFSHADEADYDSPTLSDGREAETEEDGDVADMGDKEAFGNDAVAPLAKNRFAVCTESSFASNVANILEKEYGFVRVPSEFWFVSQSAERENMYRPLKGQGCEWSDRSVFSFCDNRFENSIVLYSKVQLAHLLDRHKDRCKHVNFPPSFTIRNGEFSGLVPPPDMYLGPREEAPTTPPGGHALVYFLKDDEADYGTGVFPKRTIEECLAHARLPENKRRQYVVQPHVPRPMLLDGRKFTVRTYGMIVSPPGPERHLGIFVYQDGYIAQASTKWGAEDLDHESQITTVRSKKLKSWDRYADTMPVLTRATGEVLKAATRELIVQRKRAFELFGLDFIIDESQQPWLLEVNSGPVTKEEDFPMLRGLVKIAIIGVRDPRPYGASASIQAALDRNVSDWVQVSNVRAYFALSGEIEVDE